MDTIEIVPLLANSNKNGNKQRILKGIPSSPGIVIANASVIKPETLIVTNDTINNFNLEEEKNRFATAQGVLVQEFLMTLNKVQEESKNVVAIIESNLMILNDPYLTESILHLIDEGFSVEVSVVKEFEKQRNLFKHSSDAILRERAIELDQIKERLLRALRNQCIYYNCAKDAVIVAQALSATEIVNFKESGIKAIITEVGGIASHASIMARSFDIPSVIGVREAAEIIKENNTLIVDGFSGIIIVNPSKSMLSRYEKKMEEVEEHRKKLGELVKFPAETQDGVKLHLLANINFLDDARTAVMNGCDGAGLVRSENLIMELKQIPNEETQYKWYKEIADTIYPQPVSIRVFDIGSDKFSEGLPFNEDNPALGFRGIRYLLSRKDIYAAQLRAILRSSENKNVRILLPMISSLHEVEQSIELIEKCKKELVERDIPFDRHIPVGVMIETPAAALIADGLAESADFFSIGTNDLTQYTLAADRTNELVSDIFDSFHPAVLRLIKMTVFAAKKKGIPVGVCGELAGHAASTDLLLGLGIDELSVAPSILPELKFKIRNSIYEDARKLAEEILHCSSYLDVRKRLDKAISGAEDF